MIDLLLRAKFITLYFIWGVIYGLSQKSLIKKNSLLLHLIFSCYYGSIELRPDTSGLVCYGILERGIFWNGILLTGIFSFDILRQGIFCHVLMSLRSLFTLEIVASSIRLHSFDEKLK